MLTRQSLKLVFIPAFFVMIMLGLNSRPSSAETSIYVDARDAVAKLILELDKVGEDAKESAQNIESVIDLTLIQGLSKSIESEDIALNLIAISNEIKRMTKSNHRFVIVDITPKNVQELYGSVNLLEESQKETIEKIVEINSDLEDKPELLEFLSPELATLEELVLESDRRISEIKYHPEVCSNMVARTIDPLYQFSVTAEQIPACHYARMIISFRPQGGSEVRIAATAVNSETNRQWSLVELSMVNGNSIVRPQRWLTPVQP